MRVYRRAFISLRPRFRLMPASNLDRYLELATLVPTLLFLARVCHAAWH
jgi:hypothetical protein